ncbi:Transcriptional antiterminator, partial [Gilliamella apicola SCGC AB-598-I20]
FDCRQSSASNQVAKASPIPATKNLAGALAMTEDEISYLAIHIGVALERNYSAGYERLVQILLGQRR